MAIYPIYVRKQIPQKTPHCTILAPTNWLTYSNHASTRDTTNSSMQAHKMMHRKTTPYHHGSSTACATTQNAQLCPDNLYIQGAIITQTGPLIPTPDLAIQLMEFIFTHDKYTNQAIKSKQNKHKPTNKCNPYIRMENKSPCSHNRKT